ncbi:uncharacterized protein LOC127869305 [Dreissena polymorpha]|uniref:Cystatin domain-containing protein n=1 Tax=Dreissena polymorpha TaxID=45954 RepID=A0A9D4MDU8_DREPO|nr:uncharacterized protein LOC127869305 [Dreissena polymorpha]KAH3874793.1 hypothetical protein DPMN_038046 [Dreissena polymorpha]
MASQKALLLLVVLVSAAFAARQASDLRSGKGQGKQKRVGGWTSVDRNYETIQLAQPIVLGGWTSVGQNDKTVQQIAKFAAGQICSSYVVNAVENAEMQSVAGTNYRMDILVSKAWKCKIEVFEQIWTNTKMLTSFACKSVL